MSTSPSPSRSTLSVVHQSTLPSFFILSRRAESGGSIRLVLAGELDISSRHHFDGDVTEAQTHSGRVLLDLRALTFIDCACLAIVFAAARRARAEGAVLILLGPRGQVRRMLALVGSPPGVAVLDDSDLREHRSPVAA